MLRVETCCEIKVEIQNQKCLFIGEYFCNIFNRKIFKYRNIYFCTVADKKISSAQFSFVQNCEENGQ